MPTVTFSKSTVEKMIGKKIPVEQLRDRISMIGTDLERIEGDEIVVEIFPNRPDMLSESGFARALSAFMGIKPGLIDYKIVKAPQDHKVIIDSSVKEVRPFTACAIVKNLKFTDEKIKEIIQLQEKLHVTFGRGRKKLAIGIYPLEKIKLPITYLAKKPNEIKFQPLESEKEMTGEQILSDHPTGKAYARLLEGKKVYPIFVDANKEILSMPPIINSHKTGKVTEKTKEVFIECSGFDYRILSECLNIIVTSLAESGGEVYEMILERGKEKIHSPDLKPREWEIDFDYIRKMVGLKVTDGEIKKLLEKMGYGYKTGKLLVPCYRTDILHQMDFAEDVAIAYGYENFKPEIPNVSTVGAEDEFEVFKDRIANILTGVGLTETSSYHLTSKENNKKALQEEEVVELDSVVNSDYSVLRNYLYPSAMKILSENTNKDYPQEIFEIGTVFKINNKTETGVDEISNLVVAIANTDADFTSAKQILDSLFQAINKQFRLEKTTNKSLIEGRSGKIIINEKEIGMIGEMHPEAISNFKIEVPISLFEINLRALFEKKD